MIVLASVLLALQGPSAAEELKRITDLIVTSETIRMEVLSVYENGRSTGKTTFVGKAGSKFDIEAQIGKNTGLQLISNGTFYVTRVGKAFLNVRETPPDWAKALRTTFAYMGFSSKGSFSLSLAPDGDPEGMTVADVRFGAKERNEKSIVYTLQVRDDGLSRYEVTLWYDPDTFSPRRRRVTSLGSGDQDTVWDFFSKFENKRSPPQAAGYFQNNVSW